MNKSITLAVTKATSFKQKNLGLIGKKNFKPLLIKTRFGIHTFFMKVPLDVIILNQQNFVIKTKQNLQPYCLFFWNPRYDKVIELPSGTIKKMQIKFDTKINILIFKN